jgi:hypothetical protein
MLMKLKILLFLLIILLDTLLISGCKTSTTSPLDIVTTTYTVTTNATVFSWYQNTVDALKALQPASIPDNLRQINGKKVGGEFDTNQYFSVLTHLKLKDGYALDYIYYYFGDGGSPHVYVRPVNQTPFNNLREVTSKIHLPDNDLDNLPLLSLTEDNTTGNKIVIDGTKEGFFEYTILQILCNQFYLHWHSNHDDTIIICSQEKLNEVIEEKQNGDFGLKMPSDTVKKAKKLDYNPDILFSDNTVTVSLLTFTDWGGFYRTVYTINRAYPHTIADVKKDLLVEYQCGVTF